jgi:hypothetical protein
MTVYVVIQRIARGEEALVLGVFSLFKDAEDCALANIDKGYEQVNAHRWENVTELATLDIEAHDVRGIQRR